MIKISRIPKVPLISRAFIASMAGAAVGVLMAVVSIGVPTGFAQAPWGLLIWGAPIGITMGVATGLGLWSVAHFFFTHNRLEAAWSVLGGFMLPTVLAGAIGYLVFSPLGVMTVVSAVVTGGFALTGVSLEYACAGRAGRPPAARGSTSAETRRAA